MSEEIENRLVRAEQCQMLMLSHMGLHSIPARILNEEMIMSMIVRLDLSNNFLKELPTEIYACASLVELWLQNNPIDEIPLGISELRHLEVLDIAHTNVRSLPNELSTMEKLDEIDWFDTPLEVSLRAEHNIVTNELPVYMELLTSEYTRQKLEEQLLETLSGTKYMKEAGLPGMAQMINDLVFVLSDMYEQLEEFSLFVRRADSLLPESIKDCTQKNLLKVKHSFEEMQRDTTRQRLSADVEIKLRAIYYDRAERSEIDEMLHGIYDNVKLLEDIQHLVAYAKDIMPDDPKAATGPVVWENLLQHQEMLTEKRDAVINTLCTAMTSLYPEQKPSDLNDKGKEVAAAFARTRFATKKELERLTQVSAEAGKLFPSAFPEIDPEAIREAAKEMFKVA